MSRTLTERVGFEHSSRRAPAPRRYAASLQLVATVALIVSTMVAVTVVSIGIVRANVPDAAEAADNSLSIAILLALILAGWGGLTALMARRD